MQSGRNESNFIFTLARSAAQSIAEGYYRDLGEATGPALEHRSLKESILRSTRTPLIAEIKFTSPAEGKLRPAGDVRKIARSYERGGVSGISVLTEPKHFDGDIRYLPLVKKAVKVPVLMKDIVIDPVQIDAGARMGADAVLFIAAIFVNRLARVSLEEMFSRAHDAGLEVLLRRTPRRSTRSPSSPRLTWSGSTTGTSTPSRSPSPPRRGCWPRAGGRGSGSRRPARTSPSSRRAASGRGGRSTSSGGSARTAFLDRLRLHEVGGPGGKGAVADGGIEMTRVKICGLTREEDVDAVVDAGADAVGFISGLPSSPRNLSISRAASLISRIPPFVTPVLVTSGQALVENSDAVKRIAPGAIQLYDEPVLSRDVEERLPRLPPEALSP